VNAVGNGPDSAPLAFPPPPLSAAVWKEGALATAGQIDTWYSFPAEAGKTYFLQWDDAYHNGGAYTGRMRVSAYRGSGGNSLFTYTAGYSGTTLSVSSNDTIYVHVEVNTYNPPAGTNPSGTYAIRYYDAAALPPQRAPDVYEWFPGYSIRFDPMGGATAYQVSRSNNEAGLYTDVGSPVTHDGSTNYYFTDTGVTSGTYWYKVRAVNGSGNGPDSAPVEVSTPTPLSHNIWKEGEHTASKRITWYSFPAAAGVTYSLQLDCLNDGTGAYTGRVTRLLAYQGSDGAIPVNVNADNGYSSPPTLSVSSNDTIYVRAVGNTGNLGTYALRYYQ
jgi:hypothetical protein